MRRNARNSAPVAEAHIALGQPDEAQRGIGGRAAGPAGSLRVRVMDARLLAATGKWADASAANDAVLSAKPNYAPALALRGDLLCTPARVDEAKANFASLVEREPRNAQARFAWITLMMVTAILKTAGTAIAAMKNPAPGDVRWLYLDAVLAFPGDPARAGNGPAGPARGSRPRTIDAPGRRDCLFFGGVFHGC